MTRKPHTYFFYLIAIKLNNVLCDEPGMFIELTRSKLDFD